MENRYSPTQYNIWTDCAKVVRKGMRVPNALGQTVANIHWAVIVY